MAKPLDGLLRSIFSQVTKYTYTVIVVSDSPCPLTTKVAQQYPVQLLTMPVRKGPGAARNAGLAHVRSRYIAFVDADVILGPRWIESGIDALEGSIFSFCQGPNVPVASGEDDFMLRFRTLKVMNVTFGTANYLNTARYGLPQINTAACMIRHSYIQRHGLRFDETLLRCEDTDFGLQLLYSGAHMRSVVMMESTVSDLRTPLQYLCRSFCDGLYLRKILLKYALGKNLPRMPIRSDLGLLLAGYYELHHLCKRAGEIWGSWLRSETTMPVLKGNMTNALLLACQMHGKSYGLSPFARVIHLDLDTYVLINLQTGQRGQVSHAQLFARPGPAEDRGWEWEIAESLLAPI